MTRTLPLLALAISLAACSHSKSARDPAPGRDADSDIPTGTSLYSMFPIEPKAAFKGKPAAPNFSSGSDHARQFQKELTAAAAGGPNFAGNVTLAIVTCGKGCREIFILSAKTGKILPNTLAANGGAEFRRDSTLLVLNPKAGKKRMLQWDAKGGFSPVENPALEEAPNGLEEDGTFTDAKTD